MPCLLSRSHHRHTCKACRTACRITRPPARPATHLGHAGTDNCRRWHSSHFQRHNNCSSSSRKGCEQSAGWPVSQPASLVSSGSQQPAGSSQQRQPAAAGEQPPGGALAPLLTHRRLIRPATPLANSGASTSCTMCWQSGHRDSPKNPTSTLPPLPPAPAPPPLTAPSANLTAAAAACAAAAAACAAARLSSQPTALSVSRSLFSSGRGPAGYAGCACRGFKVEEPGGLRLARLRGTARAAVAVPPLEGSASKAGTPLCPSPRCHCGTHPRTPRPATGRGPPRGGRAGWPSCTRLRGRQGRGERLAGCGAAIERVGRCPAAMEDNSRLRWWAAMGSGRRGVPSDSMCASQKGCTMLSSAPRQLRVSELERNTRANTRQQVQNVYQKTLPFNRSDRLLCTP